MSRPHKALWIIDIVIRLKPPRLKFWVRWCTGTHCSRFSTRRQLPWKVAGFVECAQRKQLSPTAEQGIGFIIENQVIAHGVDVLNFLDLLFFIQATVIVAMDFFLFVWWLQRVFGRVLWSGRSWSFFVEGFFQSSLFRVVILRIGGLFRVEILCFC